MVRKDLNKWSQYPEELRKKLKVMKVDDFSELKNFDKFSFSGYNVAFCCTGAHTIIGTEELEKVDHQFSLLIAKICENSKIPLFIEISSAGCDKESSIAFLRIKAETEEDIKQLNIQKVCFFRPGMLTNRQGENIDSKPLN